MIQLKNLEKSFLMNEIETLAIKNMNLKVEENEFTAIMGPSGCGKSTLLNILGMLDQPSKGSYVFCGHDVANLNEAQRTKIRKGNLGFIFQSFNLINALSIYENVELPLLFQKTPKSERKKRVYTVLERMGIAHRAKHFPQQLSGGQQQRAAIARAVVTDPKLILADEPTGNLDSKNGEEVMRLLTELNQEGSTIVMATHSQRDSLYAHRILNLFDGQLISTTVDQVLT